VVAVARRARALFWAGIGTLCLVMLTKEKKRHPSQDSAESHGQAGGLQPSDQAQPHSAAPSRVAIVVAGGPQEGQDIRSLLTRVGTLPVILRTILGVQKAGATRIIVCVDPDNAPKLRRELEATKRLPQSVEWFETAPTVRNVGALLGRLAPDALTLTSEDKPVGIWSLPSAAAVRIARRCESGTRQSDLFSLLTENAAEHRDVPFDRWQQVLTDADRMAAEDKLNLWLTKPTDGVFARFNRRISVPISRQLIKWPITPNMISIFTLGVGVASGAYFAIGGYWNTVFAALLSLWASILDGCDGEVARLKLLESDFGCWLETVCDYLYYLLIFSGMAIGLARTLGPKFLVWAGLLLFGAMTTFLVAGLGRRRFARERPEQYLAIWQAQAESKRQNPILRLGRNFEFMVRRCFLPWAILAFAILNLTDAVLIAAAIGANVAWIVSLYSYRTFAVAPASSLAESSGQL